MNDFSIAAETFCDTMPHQEEPYRKRNWGGQLHSLCSYQGKLKPAIAHFLVSAFTEVGDRVLDPMGGVGTVPLEARRLGRVGLSNDLSPLAHVIARSKLEPFSLRKVQKVVDCLKAYIDNGPSLMVMTGRYDVGFGLNGPIREYFHPDTLRELLLAREFFMLETVPNSVERAIVQSALLHILHGNRPYALSRRSHPVTPFAPQGEFEYRNVESQLHKRLDRILPPLSELMKASIDGHAFQGDFRNLDLDQTVNAVITSPPFSDSLRFTSSNWMRLWFAGWDAEDFVSKPRTFLESQQRASFDVYGEFATSMHRLLMPGGLLIMHLGETVGSNMSELVLPYLEPMFEVVYAGREGVANTESHGLRDKGATKAHWYLFARAT